MGKESDIWDDSVLVNAFNEAISKYKTMHGKEYQNSAAEGEKERSTAESISDGIYQSHEDIKQIKQHDDGTTVSNTEIDVGIADGVPQSQENYHANSHGQEAFVQASHIPQKQEVLDGFSDSHNGGEYFQLIHQYYELQEKQQKVLQQLHEAGYWNYQGIGEGFGSSALWGACSTVPEQQQVPTHESYLQGVHSSCCPYVCPCLVAPCSSQPCCVLGGSCVSNIGTSINTASCTMGPQKSSSFKEDSVVEAVLGAAEREDSVVEAGLGAAERALSSLKITNSSASNIHEERGKDVQSGSSLLDNKMVHSMNSDTDLGVVLHAWYSAGFYTGKYFVEQSKKGQQG